MCGLLLEIVTAVVMISRSLIAVPVIVLMLRAVVVSPMMKVILSMIHLVPLLVPSFLGVEVVCI